MRIAIHFVLILGLSCMVLQVIRASESVKNSDKLPILSAEVAMKRALSRTGFDRFKYLGLDTMTETTLLVVENVKTPFLRSKVNGRELWRIVIEGLQLESHSTAARKDQYVRRFQILLDPESGRLLQVLTEWDGDPSELPAVPSPESVEEQIRWHGEMYHEYADDSLLITFMEALEKSPIDPLKAREIEGTCVLYSNGRIEPLPAWIISLRGIPPEPAKGVPGAVLRQPTSVSWRIVIDARTGSPIRSTNVPRVEEGK